MRWYQFVIKAFATLLLAPLRERKLPILNFAIVLNVYFRVCVLFEPNIDAVFFVELVEFIFMETTIASE